jgi:hypothetical protein
MPAARRHHYREPIRLLLRWQENVDRRMMHHRELFRQGRIARWRRYVRRIFRPRRTALPQRNLLPGRGLRRLRLRESGKQKEAAGEGPDHNEWECITGIG